MGETNKTVVTRRVPTPTSDVPGVFWLTSSRSWAASWVEKGDKKRKQRIFSASNHGFDKAKALAEQHRREMERTGRAVVRKRLDSEYQSQHQSGIRGVNYCKRPRSKVWVSRWKECGKEKIKYFSVRQLGMEGAKKAAIAHRREMERQHYTFKDRGQAVPPADLNFSLYAVLMAKAMTAPQTTGPLPTTSTTQTAAASPLSDTFGLGV
ncbi:unnamed protein product [Vitrella brassicaformis CCMP3155]|uniref:AP2/ERF domain-containing protein n=1 Tax=Vitrella brassicaformis (strain CCMP3155) TaxID=1169540 RepID=A0A0G4EUL7_VITBC|nr:unnamed protein product [Vitrella brassicaformis CCMP3155]|eukprot:CEM01921.1 unnamed protein product [Vitrella brassicaformis CCMP3155]